jgi:hypothetical protein
MHCRQCCWYKGRLNAKAKDVESSPHEDIAKPQHSVEIIKGVHIFDLFNQGTGTIEVTTFQEPILVESFLELADETLQGAQLAVVV